MHPISQHQQQAGRGGDRTDHLRLLHQRQLKSLARRRDRALSQLVSHIMTTRHKAALIPFISTLLDHPPLIPLSSKCSDDDVSF